MKLVLPWVVTAFLGGYFVFQAVGYEQEKREQQRRGAIEWQVDTLAEWLQLTGRQREDYLTLRQTIVAKEQEFMEFRRKDIKEFLESNTDMDYDEKARQLKDRHLAKLKAIKAEELDLWSAWIDTLSPKQRHTYVNGVFEHRPLDTSWYDRDLFDDLE